MPSARSFRDLDVYKKAFEQADILFERITSFPRDERFGLSEQIRRSSSAVSPLIAEAWARRSYPRAFKNLLGIAMGEAGETQAWLDHAMRRGYISKAEFEEMDDAWAHVGAMLNRMIQKGDTFSPSN